jgi:hypothetical protein
LIGTKLKIITARFGYERNSVDVSTPVDMTPNAEGKTAGLLSEPGRCKTYVKA